MSTPSRRERRAQKSAEARVARRALPLFPDTATRQAIRVRYAAALRSGSPQSKVLDEAHQEADERAARVFAHAGSPACRPGCSYCCKLFVSVRAPEARRLAAALRALPAAKLDEVRSRLAANADRVKGSTSESYPRVACALLSVDGRCVAYEARPFSCRDYHSFDVEACRKVDVGEAAGVPSHREASVVHGEVSMAWLESLAAANADTGSYELQQALHILLEDPHGDITPARESSS
jgi:Fe-S-cluster containining protein